MSEVIGDKISVCLITYNHVELIESTLRSILDQTIAGYEVIVSDDCSTDGTWERIVEIAQSDSRIRPVRTPRNMGMPGNANFAVTHSERQYIALLHHDDVCRRDLLEKWVTVLETYPTAGYVYNSYGVFGSETILQFPMPGELVSGRWLLEKYLFPQWGCVVHGTAMIRRDAWIELGGMREQFNLLSDVDFWMRLARHWDVGYVSDPVIAIRHERPAYYPDIYTGTVWNWERQRYLYEIHAANRLDHYRMDTLAGKLQWFGFRLKLSAETLKWLGYAVVRKKPGMIVSSRESETPYDLILLRVLRKILRWKYSVAERVHSRYGSG